ncbi:MAG: hypothetical protein Q8922_05915 [Bacteroidota bacterium]|nr:hypothetical protein [Bacteroidota bacterium]MDP4234086.1 hypothetical protein [Bacteroidota bacterium]MDP4243027.1 hypothetical protein [Bacteroidota bacterium]MDP4287453.1 hypothetical protein [Bacteroidota bacterium]
MKHIWFLIILSSLGVFASRAQSQWTIVARNLVPVVPDAENGAIVHKDGILWAGARGLFESRDSGLTWRENIGFPLQPDDEIVDIQLYDTANLLVTGYNGIYRSTNGGATWRILLNDTEINYAASGCFVGSPDTFVVSDFGGEIWLSNDAGNTWTVHRLDTNASQVMYRQGNLYALMGIGIPPQTPLIGGYMYESTDRGITWSKLPGEFDEDAYSFTYDSCSGSTIYVTNECTANSYDQTSQLVTSADNGLTWQLSASNTSNFFAGSIATGRQCIFTSTTTDGVLRLTGSNWIPIGGPNCAIDDRSLCALNDQLILGFDANGNLFRTSNSGGIPVPGNYMPPTISSYALFAGDSLTPCSFETKSVTIQPYSGTTCNLPTILSQRLSGKDSAYFQFIHTSTTSLTQLDSDVILWQPGGPARDYSATLTIRLSDGTVWNIALKGHGEDSVNETLNLYHAYSHFGGSLTDTIGDITFGISGKPIPYPLRARFTWDTSVFIFNDAVDPSGNRIDLSSSTGFAELQFNPVGGLSSDSVLGYIHMEFYPQAHSGIPSDTSADHRCGMLALDSVWLLRNDIICGSYRSSARSICLEGSACQTGLLSGFMRYGTVPSFRIAPNPTTGMTEIQAFSTLDGPLSAATIEVLDALGTVDFRTEADLSAGPVSLNLTKIRSGPKFVKVTTAAGERVLPLMLEK